jgi:import inner membrane translocase subunit TIM50
MLSRTAARSAQGAAKSLRVASLATPALPRRTLPAIWARGMAKDNKPRFSNPKNPVSKPTPAPSAPTDATTPRSKPAAAAPTQPAQSQAQTQTKPEVPEEQEPIPDLSKLPDLTQGIPSTLEYETAGASRSSLSAVEEPEASTSGGSGRAKGELPASAYISSADRRRAQMFKWMLLAMGLSVVGGTAYLGRDWDEDELAKNPDAPNGWGFGLWWNRAMARLGETKSYYQDPAFDKLLPDPDPSFARPYTLCISLEDMLVHSEWSRDHGWRVAKRPGVDYFLHYLSQYYEIVLFTSVPLAIAEPVLRKLDPFHFIMWPLGREATKYKDGEIVKVGQPAPRVPHLVSIRDVRDS